MKTADEILQPFVETPFRHTKIIEKDNAIKAMGIFADQFRGMEWISVKDQVPPDYERVIWFDSRERGGIEIGYFVWSQTPVDYATHWMILPANPTKVNL
jgi:hypothetical protein